MEYSNILVIQTAFIGDAILATSVVERMHSRFPSARISLLVRKGNESLFRGHPFLHEVLVWDKGENKMRNLFRMLRTVRSRKFDCVVNCHRYASSGLIAGFSGARHVAGFKQNPFSFMFNATVKHVIGDGRHEVDRYMALTADFAGTERVRPRLYPSAEDQAAVRNYREQPYVCLAPASVWNTKQLPLEKWIAICGLIPSGMNIYLIGGPGDVALCESIRNSPPGSRAVNLAGKLSMLESCALIAGARMSYVNDSAPLHLASSVNAPVTAFFCSTVPAFGFGPLSDVSVTMGIELPCRPCGIRGYEKCPLGHFHCGHHMPLPDAPAFV